MHYSMDMSRITAVFPPQTAGEMPVMIFQLHIAKSQVLVECSTILAPAKVQLQPLTWWRKQLPCARSAEKGFNTTDGKSCTCHGQDFR